MLGGTAINGQDFDLAGNQLNLNGASGTVVIPAGKAKTTIVVKPLDDRDVEGDETIELALSFDANRLHLAGRASYEVGSADTGSGKIISDDADPKEYLIAFYGAGTGGFGNEWFEALTNDAASSNGYELIRYGSENGENGLTDFLQQIDIDNNKFISLHEIEQQTVRVTGYSWGAIEAVNVTRSLNKKKIQDYKFKSAIPVEYLVTIDPVNNQPGKYTLGPQSNVQNFTSFYERRGVPILSNQSIMHYTDPATGQPATIDLASWFGGTLSGSKLRTSAQFSSQTRVDDTWQGRAVTRPVVIAGSVVNGTMYGRDVNHDTMPFYVYDDALTVLM